MGRFQSMTYSRAVELYVQSYIAGWGRGIDRCSRAETFACGGGEDRCSSKAVYSFIQIKDPRIIHQCSRAILEKYLYQCWSVGGGHVL